MTVDLPRSAYPEPHTSQWFEQFMLRDTRRAMHTAHIIRAAAEHWGYVNLNICGICGEGEPRNDEPAPADYEYTGPGWEGWPVRLCEDCCQIQIEKFGEQLRRRPPL